jgi:uncharacterized protein
MPIRKVSGGFKWGQHGHVYPTREGAAKQAQAAYANGYREDSSHKSEPIDMSKHRKHRSA